MKIIKTDRGFYRLEHPTRANQPVPDARLIGESSAIGPYDDSFDKPGSSYLWIGADHHLNRSEVYELIEHLQRWAKTGSLRS